MNPRAPNFWLTALGLAVVILAAGPIAVRLGTPESSVAGSPESAEAAVPDPLAPLDEVEHAPAAAPSLVAGSTMLVGYEPFPLAPEAEPMLVENGAPPVVVRGSGWGHSVGMSQYGAQAQALAGRGYRAILGHYYQGVEVATHPAADRQIRVNLFINRGDGIDRKVVQVGTSSRDGAAPTRDAVVNLGGPDGEHALPFPQIWTIRFEEGEYVLVDAEDGIRARGPGPVRVDYEFLEGDPTLLRLPQLRSARPRTRLDGTFQWGHLEVTHVGGGVLRPVMVLGLEPYLRGLAEMPSGWDPEALKAQAVAGRTYAIRRILDGADGRCGCHLGTTPHHQVYAGYMKEGVTRGGRWAAAVEATAGEVALYQGELAWTYYSSSHGGRSESAHHSWAYGVSLPYLQSVDDSWSHDPAVRNPYAEWLRVIPNGEFAAAVGLAEVHDVAVVSRTEGGTPQELEVRGLTAAGDEVVRSYHGPGKGIAGSVLKLHFRSRLPSQQLTDIEVLSLGDEIPAAIP